MLYTEDFSMRHYVESGHKLVGKTFTVLLLTRTKITFAYILALKIALIKLVGKIFTVCRKSAKTMKVFSIVAFIVYSILLL